MPPAASNNAGLLRRPPPESPVGGIPASARSGAADDAEVKVPSGSTILMMRVRMALWRLLLCVRDPPVAPEAAKESTKDRTDSKAKGILRRRKDNKTSGGSKRVKWRVVLLGDEDVTDDAAAKEAAETEARERRERFENMVKLARLPLLTYEELIIPMRLAFPDMFLLNPVAITLDVLVDTFEIAWIVYTVLKQPPLDVDKLEKAELEEELNGASADTEFQGEKPYTAAHVLLDSFTAVSLHVARITNAFTGDVQLWALVQIFRCLRVRDLIIYVEKINNDLSTDVKFLAVYKFTLVLISIPHWVACFWWAIPSQWASEDGSMDLPSWPSQINLLTGNPRYHPDVLADPEAYVLSLYMAWVGLTSMGYGNLTIVNQLEVIYAAVVALIQMVFYAFVLGTLFHYLVRTDESTVRYHELMKAVETYVRDRKLPQHLSMRIRAHYVFQHTKAATGSAKIFNQLPTSIRTEVAVTQYQRELTSTWCFWNCTTQFLATITMALSERHMMPSETLYNQGDAASELLWCVNGTLHITKNGAHVATIRSDLGAGQIVGEVGFFLGIAHPHTTVASNKGEVTLIVLLTADFEDIATSFPEQTEQIMANVLRKYGLDKRGNDIASGGATDQMDEDELKEFEELREVVRTAIRERNEDAFLRVITAVGEGDLETLRTLTARGFDLSSSSYDQRTALHLAALNGNRLVVTTLCELGADMDARDRFGSTPIQLAVDGRQAHVAGELCQRGSTLTYDQPATRLLEAAKTGDLDMVNMLASNGVDINCANYDDRRAIHVAAAAGNERVVEYLISNMANVHVRDRWGKSPLDDAVAANNMLIAQKLLYSSAEPNMEALARQLREAAAKGDPQRMELIIGMGVDVNAVDYDNRTALHYAVQHNSLACTYLLVAAMADVQVADRWLRPPLADALDVNESLAALLAIQCGARLPDHLAADQDMQTRLNKVLAMDMYALNRRLRDGESARKNSVKTLREKTNEANLALGRSSSSLAGLLRSQKAMFRQLAKHAGIWINEYARDSDEEDGDGDDEEDKRSSDGDGSDDGAAARSKTSSDASGKRFLKLLLQFPQAERGLTHLRKLFVEHLSPSQRQHLPPAQRRREEGVALYEMLRREFGLDNTTADEVLEDLAREMKVYSAAAPPAAHPPAPSAQPPAQASKEDAAVTRPSRSSNLGKIVRRGSGQGTALINLSKHMGEYSAKISRRFAYFGARASVATEPEVELEPALFFSDLGHSILLVSTTFVQKLAARFYRETMGALTEDEDTFARKRKERRSWADTSQVLEAFSKRSAAMDEASPAAATDRDSVDHAMFIVNSLFKVFDKRGTGEIMIKDVKRARKDMGEFGTEEVMGLVTHLGDAAKSFAWTAYQDEEVDALKSPFRAHRRKSSLPRAPRGAPLANPPGARGSHGVRSSYGTDAPAAEDELPDFAAFVGAPHAPEGEVEDAAASAAPTAAGPAGEDHATMLRIPLHNLAGGSLEEDRESDDDVEMMDKVETQKRWSQRDRARGACLTESQFYVGVASWILVSAEERTGNETDDESEDGGGTAGLKLRMPGAGAALVNKQLQQLQQQQMQAQAASQARAKERAWAELDTLFSMSRVVDLVAENVETRMETGRLVGTEHVNSGALLAVVQYVVAHQSELDAKVFAHWCTERLGVVFSGPSAASVDSHSRDGDAEDRTADPNDDQPRGPHTWERVAKELRAKAAHLRSEDPEPRSKPAAGWLQSMLGSGPGDRSRAAEGVWPWYIMSVRSRFSLRVFMLFLVIALVDALLVPMQMAFFGDAIQMEWLPTLTLSMDAFYIARMILRFHTSFINDKSVEVFTPKDVRQQYLQSDFVLDLLASFPWDALAMWAGVPVMVRMALRLFRLINARYLLAAFGRWGASLSDSDLSAGLILNLSPLLVLIHYAACVWNVLGRAEGVVSTVPTTWVDQYRAMRLSVGGERKHYDSPEAEFVDHYLVSAYWVLALISGLGASQVPTNRNEFGIFVLFGVFNMTIYAWCVGGVSGLVMKQDDEIVAKRSQLELVNAYARHLHVPRDLKDKVRVYFQQKLQRSALSSIDSEQIYDGLPMPLRMEVALQTNRWILAIAGLLRGCSKAFLDRMSAVLRERELDAESVIFHAGDACKEVLFIATGQVEVFGAEDVGDEGEGVAADVRGKGDSLGDVAFVFGIRHFTTARVTAENKAIVFGLGADAYKDLLKSFPNQEETIMENVMMQQDGNATARSAASGRASSRQSSALSSVGRESAVSGISDVSHHKSGAGHHDMSVLQKSISEAKKRRQQVAHSRLCTACAKGDAEKVKRLLTSKSLDIDITDFDGRSALHLAACGGSTQIIALLLASRANVNIEDRRKNTPLNDALIHGQSEAAEFLAKAGGLHGSNDVVEYMCDAASAPAGLPQLQLLCQYDRDVNARNGDQRTPLHTAAAKGNVEGAKLLIEKKADVNARDSGGVTPLQDALRSRADACADLLLLHGAELGTFDEAVHINQAVAMADRDHLSRLLRFRCSVNAQDALGRSALHLAASNDDVTTVNFLLGVGGVDVNIEDTFGNTPMDDVMRVNSPMHDVLVALLAAKSAQRGSHKAKPFVNVQSLEEDQANASIRAIVQYDECLAELHKVAEWVEHQAKALAKFSAEMKSAIELEREKGAVLADERPEFWVHVGNFAAVYAEWSADAAVFVKPLAEKWLAQEAGLSQRDVKKLLGRVDDALALSEGEARASIDRLCEVTFRGPAKLGAKADGR